MNKFIGITVIGLFIFTVDFSVAAQSTSSPVYSQNGTITFLGEVVQSTCSISVVNTTSGVGNNINLGGMKTDQLESTPVHFYLKPNQHCAPTYQSLNAKITWGGGNFDVNGLKNIAGDTKDGGATGVFISLKANTINAKNITSSNQFTTFPSQKKTGIDNGYEYEAQIERISKNKKPTAGKILTTATYNVSYD
ncbi:fimbrial protein [Photobacterium toruni]|uniref:Fimbrial protein n=1 Tax=Photobacterium toruni TaxID=1935446 RepID=A0ABU6L9C0_9GAMM|nr:fimbrial protein [Photobacterium toruni]MEC6816461.1 fimbrial protein [Photobacterium toruni]MEC6833182.1 fimbrial protein [Photobacterium toruni]